MVAKIMQPTASMESPLEYNEEKVQCGEATILGEFNKPERDRSVLDALERLERHRFRSQSVSFHMSINPAEAERLTDEQACELASDMMTGLGYGNQPFIVYKHTDIDRTHYHIVSIRIKEDGRRISDRQEHRRCQRILKELSEKYGFAVGNGERERLGAEGIDPRRFNPESGNVVAQMKAIYEECCRYHMTSFNQFRLILLSHGIDVQERAGDRITLILRGLDRDGKTCTAPIYERDVAMTLYDMYERRALACLSDGNIKGRERQKISNLAAYCLPYSQSERHFRNMLFKHDIDLHIHRTREGKIFGATFVDHSTKCAFKCSELDGFSLADIQNAESSGQWFSAEDTPRPQQNEESQSHDNLIGDMLASMGQKSSKSKEKDAKRKKKGKKI